MIEPNNTACQNLRLADHGAVDANVGTRVLTIGGTGTPTGTGTGTGTLQTAGLGSAN